MTDDRLQEIRARFDAIIPGPWRWYGNTATDQVFLATTTRGRLFILYPAIRTEEYVHHHDWAVSCTLDEARERVIDFCGMHHEDSDPATRERDCRCDALRDFLGGELEPEEGARHLERPYMSRSLAVRPDLRFPVGIYEGDEERRKQRGGLMRSYREMACYEVLGHCTREEFERRQRLLDADRPAGAIRPTADQALYREDFIGLDHPEATFIERAPEDIGWLLERVAELEAEVNRLDEQVKEMTP